MRIRIIRLLCGIWALALGTRLTAELLASDGWIHIPKNACYGVNLWFDFIPLAIFGYYVAITELRQIIKEVRAWKQKSSCLSSG